ncbi:MAG: LysM peptidoglycan-binding domain-containing M23 family metallopeptidase [Alphaproteobacteria bacterium]|nr:LysM peptidoglycan-binding domain-containing M23 family metallopeptidase [Alphaproteobacteria bacterium]
MMRAGAVLAVLLLCACGWVEVADPGAGDSRPKVSKPQEAASGDRRIRVGKGDSVYLIARRHGIAMRDIIERNGLAAPYRLREGQELVLPSPRRHVVQSGDSVWLLSRRYGVPFAALVRANGLKKPYTIYKGTTLRIPRGTEPLPEDAAAARAEVAPGRAPASKPSGSESARGTPPVPRPAPAAVRNAVRPGPSDAAGSRDATPAPRDAPASSTAPASTGASSPASAAAPGQPVASRPAPRTVAEPPRAPVQTALKPLPPRAGRFLRPVSGPVVTGFGPQPDGLHNDGINIAAPRGAAGPAGDGGGVAYSGHARPGYGNLLLIRHRGGWVSAYAHNDRLLVGRGDEVQRGQRIALVGSSGRVTTPQLHFELRRQGRAVDPAPHLGGG